MSELDYQTESVIDIIHKVSQNTNEKLCQMYRSLANVYSKLDDEFILFNDYNGNEAILLSDNGRIYVPQCTLVYNITVITETSNCYKDVPVKVNYMNESLNLFLTQDKIIKVTSKKIQCNNNVQHIYIKSQDKVLVKQGNKTRLEDAEKFLLLRFDLELNNVSEINFKHDIHIIRNIDLIERFANITTAAEEAGDFHIIEDDHLIVTASLKNVNVKLANMASSQTITTWLTTIGLIMILIIILPCVINVVRYLITILI